ncbi:hypothetical protein BC830DRAFT_1169605 [Chytriomyces sp. MP71]|nr:hypothetical protein BC830DRAFT_1169605 [Chytriomyces sp. MP71]
MTSAAKVVELASREDNRLCVDCGGRSPNNVNVTAATFVCARCAGLLRTLNQRIKSLSGSTFSALEVAALAKGGNAVAKAVLLATHNPAVYTIPDASADDAKILAFMKEKYVHRTWADESRRAFAAASIPLLEPKKMAIVMASAETESGDHASDAFRILPPPSFAASFTASPALPPPPKSIRTSVVTPPKPAHSVDDLFGLDFVANFTPTPAPATSILTSSDSVAPASMSLAVSDLPATAAVTSTRMTAVVDRKNPPPPIPTREPPGTGTSTVNTTATSITSAAERRRTKILAEGDDRLSKITTLSNPSAAVPSSTDLFSFDDPVLTPTNAASRPITATVQASASLFDTLPSPTTSSSLTLLAPSTLASIPIPNSNPTAPQTASLRDFADLLPDPASAKLVDDEAEDGMGSLLAAALSAVHSRQRTAEDFIVDLRSLDLGAAVAMPAAPPVATVGIVEGGAVITEGFVVEEEGGWGPGAVAVSPVEDETIAASDGTVDRWSDVVEAPVRMEAEAAVLSPNVPTAAKPADHGFINVPAEVLSPETESILFDLESMHVGEEDARAVNPIFDAPARVQADFEALDMMDNPWG